MKLKAKELIFFIISVSLFLLLASRSSFLYVFNNWDDANSYFSVGKALFNGRMPYRDVFDQKGMYLYFFYGLAYLISHATFFGVYVLEIILGVFDVIGFYKLLSLYGKTKLSVLFAPLAYAVIVTSRSFWWGGSAEELCLPFYIWGLYIICRYFRNDYPDKTMPFKSIFLGGVFAGVIANIKFTGLGFYFAWMALVWLSFIFEKKIVESLKACAVFLLGMSAPFIPWLLYFGLQNSLYEWYWGYVYINVFLYPNAAGGLYDKLYVLAKILYWLIYDNFKYFVFVIPGLFFTLFEPKKGKKLLPRLCAAVLFAFLFLGIFAGGRKLPYYSLPLSVFSVFGFALVERIFEKIFSKRHFHFPDIIAYAACIAASLMFIYSTSMNIPFLSETEESFFLYRFRDKVLEEESPTLLNIGCLDVGLYTVTDIVPSCRWFQTQTLDIPEKENNPYAEQERYIREGLVDFIIAEDNYGYYPDCIWDNYELIDHAYYDSDGYNFSYSLFKKKP